MKTVTIATPFGYHDVQVVTNSGDLNGIEFQQLQTSAWYEGWLAGHADAQRTRDEKRERDEREVIAG